MGTGANDTYIMQNPFYAMVRVGSSLYYRWWQSSPMAIQANHHNCHEHQDFKEREKKKQNIKLYNRNLFK